MAKSVAYVYFVSFIGSDSGAGNCEMEFPRPITTIDQVRGIEAFLLHRTAVRWITVTGYQLLRQEPRA